MRFCYLAFVGLWLLPVISFAENNSVFDPALCSHNIELQVKRSHELQHLKEEDQKDREHWDCYSEEEIKKVLKRDLIRRKRVGEIFGEGCFKEGRDYANAALIFQHSDVPDHFFQAFIWASQAAKLKNHEAKYLMALTLDRYLVSIGHKQLFGSQIYSSSLKGCLCLEPVEPSMSSDLRVYYYGKTLEEQYRKIVAMNKLRSMCNLASVECEHDLKTTPKGTIMGFW